ncbi:MAG: magnesium transporter [Schleiferiaceae bacterium]|jgi:magnesium transporter|nr:magnesium transporter [Schleiferiaceae bacterium]
MSFELTTKYLEEINERLESGALDTVVDELQELHAADVAEILDELKLDNVKAILAKFDEEQRADILVELDEDSRAKVLKEASGKDIAETLVDNLDSDDAADIIGELSDEQKKEVFTHIEDREQAKEIASLLTHAEDTAGALMATELIQVNENWTVLSSVKEMRKQAEDVDQVHAVYVVDDEGVLKGSLSLKKLLTTSTKTPIREIYNTKIQSVKTNTPEEDVAILMSKYDLFVIPVTDEMGKLLGRITLDDVVDVIKEEADRDYQLASGITEDVEAADKLLPLTRARLPWLVIGLFGGLIAAIVISTNEGKIAIIPKLAFFMPLIAAMGGNVGVQSSAIIVQALANKSFSGTILNKLTKELLIGLINGLICSVLLLGASTLLGYSLKLALTVSVALFCIIIFASLFGTFIPLALNRFKIDPAVATGPFITTLNDILGLSIYFYISKLIFAF